MKNIVIRVECLVRSEFTVPGWTEFTVTLVPVKEMHPLFFAISLPRILGKNIPDVEFYVRPHAHHGSQSRSCVLSPTFSATDYMFLCSCTFEPASQLSGEQHVCQLALAVG